MKLLLATNNRDKAREIIDMLDGLDVEITTLADHPDFPATIEDGDTLAANALKKAREARAHAGISALADDTGLEVDALGGGPGVYSARFAGENATYADNCAKLLREMKDVPKGKRAARFCTVMALALAPHDASRVGALHARVAASGAAPRGLAECRSAVTGAVNPGSGNRGEPEGGCWPTGPAQAPEYFITDGALFGEIAIEKRGSSGFGYDPLFIDGASGRTLAEMTLAEKNRTSHRYRALIEMRELMLRLRLVRETRSP